MQRTLVAHGRERPVWWLLVTVVATVLVSFVTLTSALPTLSRAPGLRTLVETAIALAASVAAYTFLRRWAGSHSVSDAGLAVGLTVLAAAGLLSALLQDLAPPTANAVAWTVILLRLAGSVIVLGSLVAGRDAVSRAVLRAGGIGVALALVAAVLLPLAVRPAVPPLEGLGWEVQGVLVPLAKVVVIPAFLAATYMSLQRSRHDRLFAWLAGWFLLLALSRVSLTLHPVLDPGVLHLADALRAIGYGCLVVGCLWFLREGARRRHYEIVAAERRRLAQDLHDGVAQDLAFLCAQSRWLARRSDGSPGVELLAGAAESALEESRLAISSLRRPLDEPLAVTLEREASSVARRLGCRVRLHLADVEVTQQERHALVRQMRAGVLRAGQGGESTEVHVRLVGDGEPRLTFTPVRGERFAAVAEPRLPR